MAAPTLRQAEAARRQFADKLAAQGAHAVGVEQGAGGDGWHVAVYVTPNMRFLGPLSLAAKIGAREVEVPVKIKRSEMFVPE